MAKGLIKGFTGIDAPYEAPLNAEVVMRNDRISVDKCVDLLVGELRRRGFLSGGVDSGSGLASPDGGEHINLIVPSDELPAKLAEAATLPKVPLTDIDVNWLQVVGEGWAAPLKGFMREGTLVQESARRATSNSPRYTTYTHTSANAIYTPAGPSLQLDARRCG